MGKLILFPNPGTPLHVSNGYRLGNRRGPEGPRRITVHDDFAALFSGHFDHADPQLGLRASEGEGHAKWQASYSPIPDTHLMHQMVMGSILDLSRFRLIRLRCCIGYDYTCMTLPN